MKLNNFLQFQPKQYLNTNAKIFYFDAICLDPNEFYCQILDVEFSNSATFELVDCNGVVLQSVLNFREGLFFEFRIENNYYYPVRLKATDGANTYFSTPFLVYENQDSLRIDYKLNDYYQSIRMHGYFTTFENISAVDTYTQERGLVLSGYSTITTKKNYVFEKIDNYTFLAINEALAYPEVYINGIRITDKPLLKAGTIEGQSNSYSSELQAAVDLFDVYVPTLQIPDPLQLINATPQGIYSLDTFEENYQLNFNYNVTEQAGQIELFKDDVFIANLDVLFINNLQVQLRQPNYTYTNGAYTIIIPANKFNSFFGSHEDIIITFVIQNADYDENDYDENDYFTN
jgi:hypothetical protein